MMKQSRELPIWLRRMDRVKAELKALRFPRTAEEGLHQCMELSEITQRWFVESIRSDHPGASEEAIERERRFLLARFSAADARLTSKWKRERDRHFRK